MKIHIKYQIYDKDGNEVLHPYETLKSATYMRDEYFKGGTVIEVEIVE